MKKSIIPLVLATVCLISACSKHETAEEITPTTGNKNFRIGANTEYEPNFKTGHVDGDKKIVVTWEKGDQIGLFTMVGTEAKNANAPLEILKAEDISNAGKNANFSGEISQNVGWTMDLHAYYPFRDEIADNPKAIPVSVLAQIIDGKQSKHLAQYDVMVADPIKGFKIGQSNVSLNFKHVMAIADFNISLPVASEPITIREIKIMRNDGKRIQTSGTLDITKENETERLGISSNASQSSYAQLIKVSNVTLAQGESFKAKVALLPTDWTGENISIFVTTSIGTYKIDKPGIKFEAGKRYNSELVLNNLLPVNVGDFYYSDGTWSGSLDASKKVVGVVVYKGQKGGSSNGYVIALGDTEVTKAKGDFNGFAFDIPEMTNIPRGNLANAPENYYSTATSTTFLDVEDWKGKQYGDMIKTKRNEQYYDKIHFLLKSVDFAIVGVAEGPAAKGSWFTPTHTQMHQLTLNYDLVQQRIEEASGLRVNEKISRWVAAEPDIWSTTTYFGLYTAFNFTYSEIQRVGNWKFRFSNSDVNTLSLHPIRPYLEF